MFYVLSQTGKIKNLLKRKWVKSPPKVILDAYNIKPPESFYSKGKSRNNIVPVIIISSSLYQKEKKYKWIKIIFGQLNQSFD